MPSNLQPTFNLYVVGVSSTDVMIGWNVSTSASEYVIYRSTNGVSFSKIGAATSNTYIDMPLYPDTTYYYKVESFKSNKENGYSNVINVKTVKTLELLKKINKIPLDILSNPYPPDCCSTYQPIFITLNWESSFEGTTLYSLYFGNHKDPPLIANNLKYPEYTLPELNYSTTYYWYVKAQNATKTFTSSLWKFTTIKEPKPFIPKNLTAELENNSVLLVWSASPIASGYAVFRSADGKYFEQVGQSSSTNYTDKSISPSTTYYYKIVAFNLSGQSEYSNQVSIKTLNPPKPQPNHNLAPFLIIGGAILLLFIGGL